MTQKSKEKPRRERFKSEQDGPTPRRFAAFER
jgi:hypothetical protein